jgi:predicted nuclease of predicted toxin-antitoxin system
MRVLLDENVPVQLKGILQGHTVKSVNDKDVGWKNIKNGALLDAMAGVFDLLITADRNLHSQQRLSGRNFSILVLPTNKRREILGLGDQVAKVIAGNAVGEYVTLEITGEAHKRPFDPSGDGSGGGRR